VEIYLTLLFTPYFLALSVIMSLCKRKAFRVDAFEEQLKKLFAQH